MSNQPIPCRSYRAYQRGQLDQIRQLDRLSQRQRDEILAASAVFPFRVNSYVLDELIDWDAVADDPMFRLTFPQAGMLEPDDLDRMLGLVRRGAPADQVRMAAREIQSRLNPHPAGQLEFNVPKLDGKPLRGLQHKYRETVLFFPAQGQTCHSYCTYCFRWAQFVGLEELKFVEREADVLVRYLREHPEVTDVLLTGGDPMVMRSHVLARYVEPLLAAGLPNLKTIRIGTKAMAWWPYRFVTDPDADDLLRLFEKVADHGLHLGIMAHYSHPVELSTAVARAAVRRVRDSGAVVRCQGPLIRGVNDDADVWASMWQHQVALGAVPYYRFVERDTGARAWFEVPLAEAHAIFTAAYARVSGLARTVRGPSMSATPGKILVDGVVELGGEKAFVLKFLQGRDPAWVNRVFFARYDPAAAWLDQLEPAFGAERFFFEAAPASQGFPATALPVAVSRGYSSASGRIREHARVIARHHAPGRRARGSSARAG
jgi:L-lysine 2,3-aminomutase